MKYKLPLRPIVKTMGYVLPIAFVIYLTIRWFYYVHTYSVNVLFLDQWDLSIYIFNNASLKDLFLVQHGPPRQGLGFFVTKVVASLSGWNTRTECFAIGVIMFLAGVLAVYLKRIMTKRISWTDVIIPIFFISPMHWELFGVTPNPAHGSVPVLLIVSLALILQIRNIWLRYSLYLVVNFLTIYTGFGIFVGLISPLIFLLDVLHAFREGKRTHLIAAIVCIVLSILSFLSFFIDYRFLTANPTFSFPIDHWWYKYPEYVSALMADFIGLKIRQVGMAIIVPSGLALYIGMILLALLHIFNEIRGKKAPDAEQTRFNQVIILFTTFTILFALNTAVGRASLGIMGSQISRYMSYIIPGAFAIYLYFANLKNKRLSGVLMAFCVVGMIAATIPMRIGDYKGMRMFKDIKTKWVDTYLRTEDIAAADAAAGWAAYPDPERTHLKEKLDQLKANRQNLYLDQPQETDQ